MYRPNKTPLPQPKPKPVSRPWDAGFFEGFGVPWAAGLFRGLADFPYHQYKKTAQIKQKRKKLPCLKKPAAASFLKQINNYLRPLP
jgi:hypothetical protein